MDREGKSRNKKEQKRGSLQTAKGANRYRFVKANGNNNEQEGKA